MRSNSKADVELQIVNGSNCNQDQAPLLPGSCAPWPCDYVLVAKKISNQESEAFQKQEAFTNVLKAKNFDVKEFVHEEKRFFGIRAPDDIFEKYIYLLKVSDACNGSGEQQGAVSVSTRIRIVHFILEHTYIDTGENLTDLMDQDVFETKFCLHDKEETKELKKRWANWLAFFRWQPMNIIRNYFGEKIALYYLWLGWYTWLLCPAAALGVFLFLYGLALFTSNPLIAEVCEADIIMCPLCDEKCSVWQLSDTCFYAKVTHLFDNEGTVAFAMFMALWATVFLAMWKRRRAEYVSQWKVFEWCEDEEELILEVVNDPNCSPKKYQHSFLHNTLVMILVTLMLILIIGLAQALVVFRVVATGSLSASSWTLLKDNANIVAVILGAVLHYLTITIMTRVNEKMACKLCDIEKTRTVVSTERSFTVKMFTFQFFTHFSSLFYVAFFLGRINGYPGSYHRIAGKWRLEECHPSGCLTDLFIQMAIIMVLKQTINNIFELCGPWFSSYCREKETKKLTISCIRNQSSGKQDKSEVCKHCTLNHWLHNYNLSSVNVYSLFNEFLEMVIQFSFTTIFVAAFPLAPLLALLNNIIEIRLDAYKMVNLERRLVPNKTNNIGVWSNILQAIGIMAVIANGLVIGVTSDFIPRLVYRYHYGPCATGQNTDMHCMVGYINNSLSVAYMSDERIHQDFQLKQMVTPNGLNVTHCRYKDYRNDLDYGLTSQFWLILAVRFAFVILFEHIVLICKGVTGWFFPDCPLPVKNNRLEDKLERLKAEFRWVCACTEFTPNIA
uniref:Anoctamin n=1 Tax=Paramormyrops kingsleyae TaxID=1676925 RepID=A0A3B3Q8R8_9TELE